MLPAHASQRGTPHTITIFCQPAADLPSHGWVAAGRFKIPERDLVFLYHGQPVKAIFSPLKIAL
jgi:hypothetical protein